MHTKYLFPLAFLLTACSGCQLLDALSEEALPGPPAGQCLPAHESVKFDEEGRHQLPLMYCEVPEHGELPADHLQAHEGAACCLYIEDGAEDIPPPQLCGVVLCRDACDGAWEPQFVADGCQKFMHDHDPESSLRP